MPKTAVLFLIVSLPPEIWAQAAAGASPTPPVVASRSMLPRSVDPGQQYERAYVIVPMVGAGTWDDPKRPMFTPAPHTMVPGNRTGIIAFNHVASDDGTVALVEIVAATKAELAAVIAPIKVQLTLVPSIQLFERGTSQPEQVQASFQALKMGFDLSQFRVVVP